MINEAKWSGLNPALTFSKTTKKFNGKYLYKVELDVFGSHVLRYKKFKSISDLADYFDYVNGNHLTLRRSISIFNSSFWVDNLTVENTNNVYKIALIKDSDDSLSMRLGSDNLIIYCDDIDHLYNICLPFKSLIKKVTGPSTQHEKDLLNNNCILQKTCDEFNYKVNLKSNLSKHNPQAVLNILTNLENTELIKVPNSTKTQLNRKMIYCNNVHVFAKDPDVITMINLALGDLVTSIHEIKEIDYDKMDNSIN